MTSGRPSAALNPEQCEAIWNNAVPSGDLLAKSAAAPFIVNFTQVDKDGSGDISKAEFQDACAKGLVKNIENLGDLVRNSAAYPRHYKGGFGFGAFSMSRSLGCWLPANIYLSGSPGV